MSCITSSPTVLSHMFQRMSKSVMTALNYMNYTNIVM